MNAKELKEGLRVLDLKQKDLARILGRNESTVSLWCNGKEEIPVFVSSYIEMALQVRKAKEALSAPI